MGFSEGMRATEFRMAYWQRVEEMAGLLTSAAQEQALATAKKANLGRRTTTRFKEAMSGGAGPLSIEEADEVAKRYAMWTVRKKFDWGVYPQDVSEMTKRIDADLCSGIYDLDVTLRREVEELLLSGRRDAARASHLRDIVAGRAGAMAAALDLAPMAPEQHPEWETIAGDYDEVCNSLDRLLTLAGAPDQP